jgi:hypothetical protein
MRSRAIGFATAVLTIRSRNVASATGTCAACTRALAPRSSASREEPASSRRCVATSQHGRRARTREDTGRFSAASPMRATRSPRPQDFARPTSSDGIAPGSRTTTQSRHARRARVLDEPPVGRQIFRQIFSDLDGRLQRDGGGSVRAPGVCCRNRCSSRSHTACILSMAVTTR